MTKFTLYNYWRSSASFRVRTALHLKEIPFEYVAVHIAQGEQSAAPQHQRNPMNQVPTLVIEDASGSRAISQSIAILEYLEEAFPERGPSLLPEDPYLRARTRELAEIVNAGIQPHQNLTPMRLLNEKSEGAGLAHAIHHNETGLLALETRIGDIHGSFMVGDAPTIADLCLIPQLYSARRFGIANLETRFPTLLQIEARCMAISAFQKSHPDAQPDAVRS